MAVEARRRLRMSKVEAEPRAGTRFLPDPDAEVACEVLATETREPPRDALTPQSNFFDFDKFSRLEHVVYA